MLTSPAAALARDPNQKLPTKPAQNLELIPEIAAAPPDFESSNKVQ
jgi:hypothetical protein